MSDRDDCTVCGNRCANKDHAEIEILRETLATIENALEAGPVSEEMRRKLVLAARVHTGRATKRDVDSAVRQFCGRCLHIGHLINAMTKDGIRPHVVLTWPAAKALCPACRRALEAIAGLAG